jgi:hypothetical protein
MLKGQCNTTMKDKSLDALVEALMPIVFGTPNRRVVGRRRLIRLPRHQAITRVALARSKAANVPAWLAAAGGA